MNTMTIQGTEIQIKEYRGKRVVTFKDIDAVHQRPEGTARKRFADNRKRFISGVDFYKATPSEFRTAIGEMDSRQQNDITLITESGYLMLVKSFTDDLAWKVQRELVDTYFRLREPVQPEHIEDSTVSLETYLEAARIMASVPDSKQNVINCLRHVVPDIDFSKEIEVQLNDTVPKIPIQENTVTQVSVQHRGSYKEPFNHNQFYNYLIQNQIKHYWLETELGCSRGLISKWGYGQSRPTEYYRAKLCEVFGLPQGYFDNTRRVRRTQGEKGNCRMY